MAVDSAGGGGGGGLAGADAPECRFGSIVPVAGRLVFRGDSVGCISPAAARTAIAAPVSARGHVSAASWALLPASSFARFHLGTAASNALGTAATTAAAAATSLTMPLSLPLDHPLLLSAPPPGEAVQFATK